jgi:hypothetical protein
MSDLPRIRAKKRVGRCWELAARALLRLPAATSWRLVHGIVTGPGGVRMGHAWLARGDQIWDAVRADFFLAADYLTLGEAAIIAEYSRREMAAEVSRHRHYGPWIDHPDAAHA